MERKVSIRHKMGSDFYIINKDVVLYEHLPIYSIGLNKIVVQAHFYNYNTWLTKEEKCVLKTDLLVGLVVYR